MKKLNDISPSFCLAKWYRTNLRLDTGLSYSCHHCTPQRIDIEQIKDDPSKLTNTDHVLEKRQEMLDGKRPEVCNFCWVAEDEGKTSDRAIKSSQINYQKKLKQIDAFAEATKSLTSVPSNLEISFDNTCNLKCSYCSPAYSSKWEEEIKQFGPYPTSTLRTTKSQKILNRDHNPYVEAFWEWWPELSKNLDVLRITGGEPLLSKKTYKLMDKILEDEVSFEFAINTNLIVDIDPLIEKLNANPEVFQNFKLYTSVESSDEKNEYSRYGFETKMFKDNVEKYLSQTTNKLHFMCTVNILSITGYSEFLKYYLKLRKRHGTRIGISLNYLRYPVYLDMRILPLTIKESIQNELTDTKEKLPNDYDAEKRQLDRLISYLMLDIENKDTLRNDFVAFINEYDKRRNTNFPKVYPELLHLLTEWKKDDQWNL